MPIIMRIKRHATILLRCAVALCVINQVNQTAGAAKFSVVGPGGGGAMFHATISPHDSRVAGEDCRYRERELHADPEFTGGRKVKRGFHCGVITECRG